MKIQPDFMNVQAISGYGPGWVAVAGEKISSSLVLSSTGERFAWDCREFKDLGANHFSQLAALNTELVIFGSGSRLRFPPPNGSSPCLSGVLVSKPWTPKRLAAPTTFWPEKGAMWPLRCCLRRVPEPSLASHELSGFEVKIQFDDGTARVKNRQSPCTRVHNASSHTR